MTSNDTFDEALDPATTGLTVPRLTPDPVRAARVRAKCRARLVRQQQRNSRTAGGTTFATRLLVPVLAGGFCVFYVAALVATTLHLYGVFL